MAGPKKSKKPKTTPTTAASPSPPPGDEVRPMVVGGSGDGSQSGGLVEDPGSSAGWTTATHTPKPKPTSTPTFREDLEDAAGDWEEMFRAGAREGGRRIEDSIKKDVEKIKKDFKHTQGNCLCGKKHGPHELDMRKTCWCGKSGPHAVGTPR